MKVITEPLQVRVMVMPVILMVAGLGVIRTFGLLQI